MIAAYKTAFIAVLVASMISGIAAWCYQRGRASAVNEYLPQVEDLKASIRSQHLAALETEKTRKENTDAIAKQTIDDVMRIREYYRLHLPKASNSACTRTIAVSASGVNATGAQQADVGLDPESCILDAETVTKWQDWAVMNHFPVN